MTEDNTHPIHNAVPWYPGSMTKNLSSKLTQHKGSDATAVAIP